MSNDHPPIGGVVETTDTPDLVTKPPTVASVASAAADIAASFFNGRPPAVAPRAPPTNKFELFDRGGRPLLRYACTFLLFGFGLAIMAALWRSALTGLPMPDLTAGLAPVAIVLVPQIIDQFTRHAEVTAQRA